MGHKELLALGFMAVFFGNIFWCLFVAYPLVLDTSIRKGKSWLYLPLKWRGFYKKMVTMLTPLFSLSILAMGLMVLWFYLTPLSFVFFGLGLVALVGLHFFVTSFVLKKRFRQQEDSYFYMRSKLYEDMETKGKKLSEGEISNLASFQHQNLLREADKNGKLRQALVTQAKMAKEEKKMRRQKLKVH